MQFDELKLPYGAAVQLQVTDGVGQPKRYSCRLLGCIPGRSLLLSVPRENGKLARFRAGQKMAVRLMVANGMGLFACVVEAQASQPYPLLYTSYPDTVKFKGIRSATRVAVDLPIRVSNESALESAEVSGYLADVSINGARLELREALAEIGDRVTIHASLETEGIERAVELAAVIRSRVERSTHEQTHELPAVYGVEFTERDEDNRLVLYAYVYSQIVEDQTPRED